MYRYEVKTSNEKYPIVVIEFTDHGHQLRKRIFVDNKVVFEKDLPHQKAAGVVDQLYAQVGVHDWLREIGFPKVEREIFNTIWTVRKIV